MTEAALEFRATLRERDWELAVDLAAGETVAVLGPNGAGKSTLLAVLAGLLRPDTGRATLAGRELFAVGGSGRDQWLPPHRRGISLLAQEALLFPHRSVLDNVAYGPLVAGASRGEARDIARRRLADVEASELEGRRPAELSGGQAQRVALARALAPDPALLLLDEPMAALDATVAPHLRRMLREQLRGRTTVLVTHEVLDAYTLADRVIVLDAGRIVEQGPTAEVLERPRTAFTADLAGLELLTGVRTARGLRLPDGTEVEVDSSAKGDPIPVGVGVACAFRPSRVEVREADGPSGPSAPGALRATITDLEPRGDVVRVRSAVITADVAVQQLAAAGWSTGDVVEFAVDPRAAVLYPR
ncbi:molybdate transport system ATP-binding protein [Plantibacter sp. VKM Ac-1784]|uniref:Molybdate transport system ATP-binding protein n=1 Tax=Plantibacter elymi (nom. nud.) TaxID=199708 RepID=A0ABY1RGX8_9MICO|nr:ABC transporter ATP-binding protein [Plantibacter sp. VKM Ac-1784]SMQ72637.1 molybdate transport system ATP-binding protein [Plantibacter sp. VKM Ac-1784]